MKLEVVLLGWLDAYRRQVDVKSKRPCMPPLTLCVRPYPSQGYKGTMIVKSAHGLQRSSFS